MVVTNIMIDGKISGRTKDDYESEIVNKEALRKCEGILDRRKINRGVFAETLRKICEKGLALGLDF